MSCRQPAHGAGLSHALWFLPAFVLAFVIAGAPRAAAEEAAHAGQAAAAATNSPLHDIAVLEDRRDLGEGRLAGYLASERPEVRRRAVVALGRIGDPAAVAFLLPLLSSPDVALRRDVAFALGQIGSAAALPGLLGAAKSPDAELAARALAAIGKIAGANPDTRGAQTTEALTSGLRHPDAAVRVGAAFGLSRSADSTAVGALAAAVADPDRDVRIEALHALERIGGASVGPARAALAATRDRDPMVRAFALRSVGKIGQEISREPAFAEAIARGLDEPDWRTRTLAARAAESTGTGLAAEDLLDALDDRSVDVREAAVAALGALTGVPARVEPQIRARLARLATDPAPGVRFRAGVALAQRLHGTDLEALDPFVNDADPFVASKVIVSLGTGKLDGHHGLLRRHAGDPKAEVRAAALEALAAFEDPKDRAFFLRAARDPDWVVATVAADALGKAALYPPSPGAAVSAKAEASAALRGAYERFDGADAADVRSTALASLAALGRRDDVAFVRAAVADPEVNVRRAAAQALQTLAHETVVPRGAGGDPAEYPGDFGLPAGRITAVLTTDRGAITLELFGDEHPSTVANFVGLARRGFYDGRVFHRVVPNFVIQTGCPRGDGWGSAGYAIRCEIGEERYETGSVGMAHSGKDTGGSQFFITHSPQHHLEGRYTLFGRVASGQEVVDAITERDVLRRVEIRGAGEIGAPPDRSAALAALAGRTGRTGAAR